MAVNYSSSKDFEVKHKLGAKRLREPYIFNKIKYPYILETPIKQFPPRSDQIN